MSRLVAVTGASGYLGGRCVAALRAAGLGVRRLVRVPREPGDVIFRLGEKIDPAAWTGVDALIHAAYDFGPLGWAEVRRVNVDGSQALLRAAADAGVRRVVAVSSISAFPDCRSDYGRAKLLLEEAAAARGGVSVRPGLVYGGGKGGMFGILARLCGLPILPLIDGGRQSMFLTHADDAAAAIVGAVDWSSAVAGGPVTLAHPEAVYFRDILRAAARGQGRNPFFVSIRSGPLLGVLRGAEAAGLRLRARSDNLMGLLHANPSPDFAGAQRLGLKFRRFVDQSPAALFGAAG